ncbi:MAG: TolC family protein, partial [Deltaproteobacteria bacterium]|nr:TolC family protein [Deltaproteobacteria bacterium]
MVRTLQMYCCVTVLCLYAGYSKAADYHYNNLQQAIEIEPSKRQAEVIRLLDKESISLDDLLKAASLCNPEIAAAQNDIGAATGRLRQAGLYPNPIIEFEAEDIPADNVDFSRNQNTVSITQPIILSKRRSTAISSATAEQAALRFALQNTIHQVLGDVRLAYIDLAYHRRAFTLHGELLANANKILAIAQGRFDARAATESELIAAQLKSTKIELNRRKKQFEIASSAKRLQAFLPDVLLPLKKIRTELRFNLPGIDLDRLLTDARELHPLILASQKTVEAAEHRLALAKAERIPDVSFRGAYGRDTSEGENIIEVGISIPLPFFNRNQGRIAEMRHVATRSHHDARSRKTRLEADITAAQASYMSARDFAAAYQTKIVPAAGRAFEKLLAGYRAGRAGFPDLLDAQEE